MIRRPSWSTHFPYMSYFRSLKNSSNTIFLGTGSEVYATRIRSLCYQDQEFMLPDQEFMLPKWFLEGPSTLIIRNPCWILKLNTGYWIQDTGYRIQDTIYWILDTGYCILDTGYWILDTGYWILDTGYWILDTGYWILDNNIYNLLTFSMDSPSRID